MSSLSDYYYVVFLSFVGESINCCELGAVKIVLGVIPISASAFEAG